MKRFFLPAILIVVGLCVALGGSAIAQTVRPVPVPAQVRPAQPIQAPGQTPTRPAPASPNSNVQLSPLDRAFFLEANQAALGNIQLGELALERSNNNTVRQYAQAEIAEQRQVRADSERLAPTLGVNLPSRPAPRQQAALAQLSQLSGDRFDAAFLSEGGVNAHLEAAALYQREAAFGQNRDLVGVADRFLPIINQHFDIASELTDYEVAEVPVRFNNIRTTINPNSPSTTPVR